MDIRKLNEMLDKFLNEDKQLNEIAMERYLEISPTSPEARTPGYNICLKQGDKIVPSKEGLDKTCFCLGLGSQATDYKDLSNETILAGAKTIYDNITDDIRIVRT